jgi:hypothetical protein
MRTSVLAPLALAAALLLTVAGCAADEPTSSDDTSQSSSDDDDDSDAVDETEDTGTSDLVPVFTDAPATPGPEVVITADGFEPADLTVSSGDVVTFTSGDDGMYGLIVNQLDGVTVARSIPEYYQFNDPGTYYLTEDISGNTGTITVE